MAPELRRVTPEFGFRFIVRHGLVEFFHYDFYAQASAKLEADHARDLEDVRFMWRDRLVSTVQLRELFEATAPELIRFPAIDPANFRRCVLEFCAAHADSNDPS